MRGLVWFREDLRVKDHLALNHAAESCKDGIVAIYIIDEHAWQKHHMAKKRIGFIYQGLMLLAAQLKTLHIPFLIVEVKKTDDIAKLILNKMEMMQATALYFNRQYEVDEMARDEKVVALLNQHHLASHAYDDAVILPPGSVKNKQGDYFKIFTAYKHTWLETFHLRHIKVKPTLKPQKSIAIQEKYDFNKLKYSHIDIKPWLAGEEAANDILKKFIRINLFHYDKNRDFPAIDGTSLLSPYLSAGMISARYCFLKALNANDNELYSGNKGALTWMNEFIWRDFYKHILVAVPRVSMHRAYLPITEKLPWRYDKKQLIAWQQGNTGYPIIDAAMRQLNELGWMHNRLRMITAMFFSKNMLFDWRLGEDYFINQLIDGDLAANNGGWQWSASTGTDAAPYFRVFNPITQSERFDPDGKFIRQYCPELATLDNWAIHDPHHRAPSLVKKLHYPAPFVDLKKSRQHAIDVYSALKKHKT